MNILLYKSSMYIQEFRVCWFYLPPSNFALLYFGFFEVLLLTLLL